MNAENPTLNGILTDGPALRCRGISARYNRITVVEGVDFDLHGGEMLAVLGPNGAGKSSLLGAIAGVVNGSGKIHLDGDDLGGLLAHQRASRGIAFVPERRGNVFPSMTVAENMEIGLRMIPPGNRDAQRDFIWSMFPILKSRAGVTAGVLSGGEQQMLAIGMALGRTPRYLVLDEPSQGLAPAVFDILENAFEVLKKRGLALLLAEQNLPFAARTADRYFILSHGEITQVGHKEDLADLEKVTEAFLS